jgi:EmrB/QacA subfamily drug resistance transporter
VAILSRLSEQQTNPWLVLVLVCLGQFMVILDATIVNVALPSIERDLGFSATSLQWVINSYTLMFGGFLLLGGRAGDLIGRKRVFLAGVIVFSAASLLNGLATSSGMLIAFRGLQGLGAALVSPAALSIITTTFEEGPDRTKALGVWSAIAAGGGAFGLLLGGILTDWLSWEWIFFVNVPIGIAAFVLSARYVPESRAPDRPDSFDIGGAVSVTAGLMVLVYAIVKAQDYGWGSAKTIGLAALAVALLVAFVVIESRVEAPLMPLRIFGSRTLAGANIAGLFMGAGFFGFIFIGTLYMQQVLGYSALETGAAWMVASSFSMILSAPVQKLVTRFSAGPVLMVGMAMVGGGILWSTVVPVHAHYWVDLAAPWIVVGAGTAFAFIPISIAGLQGVTEQDAGLASGLLNTSQQLGGAIGVAIASTVSATRLTTLTAQGKATDVALTGGFHWAFWVCGLIALAAVPTTAMLVRRSKTAAGEPESAVPPHVRVPALDAA